MRLLFCDDNFHAAGILVPFGVMVHALAHDGVDALAVNALVHQVGFHFFHAPLGDSLVVLCRAGLGGIAIQGNHRTRVLFQDAGDLVQLGGLRAQLDAVVGKIDVLEGAVIAYDDEKLRSVMDICMYYTLDEMMENLEKVKVDPEEGKLKNRMRRKYWYIN